eukprot:scaffold6.g2888.t1
MHAERPFFRHRALLQVFADANLDQSLVIEIVECQAGVLDAEAGGFYLEDLAQHNEAVHSQVDSVQALSAADMPGVPAAAYKALAVGQQAVSKGRQGKQAVNKVQILLCCVRLLQQQLAAHRDHRAPSYLLPRALCAWFLAPHACPPRQSDVLITLNTPIWISERSAAAEHVGAGFKGAHLVAPDLFRRALATLEVLDWGLFGGGGGEQ